MTTKRGATETEEGRAKKQRRHNHHAPLQQNLQSKTDTNPRRPARNSAYAKKEATSVSHGTKVRFQSRSKSLPAIFSQKIHAKTTETRPQSFSIMTALSPARIAKGINLMDTRTNRAEIEATGIEQSSQDLVDQLSSYLQKSPRSKAQASGQT